MYRVIAGLQPLLRARCAPAQTCASSPPRRRLRSAARMASSSLSIAVERGQQRIAVRDADIAPHFGRAAGDAREVAKARRAAMREQVGRIAASRQHLDEREGQRDAADGSPRRRSRSCSSARMRHHARAARSQACRTSRDRALQPSPAAASGPRSGRETARRSPRMHRSSRCRRSDGRARTGTCSLQGSAVRKPPRRAWCCRRRSPPLAPRDAARSRASPPASVPPASRAAPGRRRARHAAGSCDDSSMMPSFSASARLRRAAADADDMPRPRARAFSASANEPPISPTPNTTSLPIANLAIALSLASNSPERHRRNRLVLRFQTDGHAQMLAACRSRRSGARSRPPLAASGTYAAASLTRKLDEIAIGRNVSPGRAA